MGEGSALTDHRARLRSVLRAVVLPLCVGLGCGVTPNPEIADEFHERLEPADRGWARVPCPDRAAKVKRTEHLVAMAQDLRAHLRDFEDPPPPELLERMTNEPMLGRAEEYRCVVQDFTRIDLNTEPDFEDVRDLVANLYMIHGHHLMRVGRQSEGWAHVVEAIELYRHPVAPGVEKHISLLDVLRLTSTLLDEHPPPPSTIDALVAAIDDTAVSPKVACSSLRHGLLTQGVKDFRLHFGQREREAFAQRFGLNFAMRTWKTPQRVGAHRLAEWRALRDAYDRMTQGCATRPYGHTLKRAARPMVQLDMLHPPSGIALRITADRLNRLGLVTDMRMSVLARLRSRALHHSLGRDPTTAQLALSFGRRPLNAWDQRGYTFVVHEGRVTVSRGPYRHDVSIAPDVKPPTGRSYAEDALASR